MAILNMRAPLTLEGQVGYAAILATFTGTAGDDVANVAAGGELTGFTGGTLVELQDATGDVINAGAGSDYIVSGGGADTITGGAGADGISSGAGDDKINIGTGEFASGESIDGGANGASGTRDQILLTSVGTIADFSLGTVVNIETLTGSAGDDTVTLKATQLSALATLDLLAGTKDTLNVVAFGDISGNSLPSIAGVEIGNLVGTGGDDSVKLTGTQLDAIMTGSGTINLGAGTDTIKLTSTSTDLNALGGTDTSILGVETFDLSGAASGVLVDMGNQSEAFTFIGSAGADTITGGFGADTVNAGDGNDLIDLWNNARVAAGETIDGGAGTDTVRLNENVDGSSVDISGIAITNVEKLDTSTGGPYNQTITLTATQFVGFTSIDMKDGGVDKLNVIASGDITSIVGVPTIAGVEAGNLVGTGGDDSITLTGAQLDAIMTGSGTINLGAGTDTINLTSTSTDLNTLNHTDGFIQGVEAISAAAATSGVFIDLGNQTEAFKLTGSSFDDRLVGGDAGDTIAAGAGNDTIELWDGAKFGAGESIDGGAGTDKILLGEPGTHDLSAGTVANVETLSGSGGNDTVVMTANQWLGFTTIDLAGGTDVLNIVASGDISGIAGLPTITNVETSNLVGTAGNDSITLTGKQLDTIILNAGTINLGAGTDTIKLTTTSNDLNTAGGTDASIEGLEIIDASGAASGVLLDMGKQAEALTLIGGVGDDTITGGAGADVLTGGAGADTIVGRDGADTVDAGDGNDTIEFWETGQFAAGESIDGGAGTDTIAMQLPADGASLNLSVGTIKNVENVTGVNQGSSNGYDQTLTLTAAQLGAIKSINLNDGTDTVNVVASGDVSGLTLGTIDSTTTENVYLIGTTGNDTITLTGAQLNAILNGTVNNGIDLLAGTTDTIKLTSTSTDLNLLGDAGIAGVEIVDGSAASGILINLSKQAEAFAILGGAQADTITGGTSADTISTGGGDDTINIATGQFVAGESIDGGADSGSGTRDQIVLTSSGTTVDFTTGSLTNVETLTGSGGNDTVTLKATDYAAFKTIDLAGGADVLNVLASGDITALTLPTVSNVETGNLTGTAGTDNVTLTGAQLDSIIIGAGTINLGNGTDTINLTSTSADLNTLGATDASIQGVEAISAAGAGAGVTISLTKQSDTLSIIGSDYADTINAGTGVTTITGGKGADTIIGSSGNDTINIAVGDFAAGESISTGTGTNTLQITTTGAGVAVDFSVGAVWDVASLQTQNDGNNQTITIGASQLDKWAFMSIDMKDGSGDVLNVKVDGKVDVTALTFGTIQNSVETVNLVGTAADDSITLSGAQLNTILNDGNGNLRGRIDLGAGTDTINLTSDSVGLLAINGPLSADDYLKGVEKISAKTVTGAFTFDFGNQSETLIIEGSQGNDTITGGMGADTIDAQGGDDLIRVWGLQHFNAGAKVDGGTGNDTLQLAVTSANQSMNLSQGTVVNVENLSTVSGYDNQTITLNATQLDDFVTINMQDKNDTLNVVAEGDISKSTLASVSNVETGNLVGTSGNDTVTLTGAQLDSIIIGAGTISLDAGTDTIKLTSNSSDLKVLGASDSLINGLEIIDGRDSTNVLDINLGGQNEGFTVYGGTKDDTIVSSQGSDSISGGDGNDKIVGNNGADTVDAGAGDDTVEIWQAGQFAAGESLDGGANTAAGDSLVFQNTGADVAHDISLGTVVNFEKLSTVGSNNETISLTADQFVGFTSVDLGGGTNDTLNVIASGDISSKNLPTTVANIENVYLYGTAGDDTVTMKGEQLDAILGKGTSINRIDLGSGSNDTLNLTTTSTALNNLGNFDVAGLEKVSAAGAAKAVAISLANQTEAFTITGSAQGDTITGGTGADTISTGAGDDTINLATGQFKAGEVIDGGADTGSGTRDQIVLTSSGMTVDFTTGTVTNVETLTGSGGNDTITMTATEFGQFANKIDLGGGTADVLNVVASGNISGLGTPTVTGVETGNLTGTSGNDTVTLTGAQLDAIINGAGTINLGAGTGDTINLTSTSADLNGAPEIGIVGVEAISAVGATAGVLLTLGPQSESFTLTGGAFGDTITAGSGNDTVTGSGGNDTMNGGAGTDTAVYSGTRADYTISLSSGVYTVVDNRPGSPDGTDTVTNFENWQFSDGSLTNAQLDLTAPTVSSIAFGTHDGTLKAGESVDIVVTFSENVNVAGTPTLTLNNGGTASYLSGSGTSTVTFHYTASAGQDTPDITVSSFNLTAGGASVKDAQGNPASVAGALTNPGGPADIEAVDTIVPAASVTVGSVTADDILTAAEAGGKILIVGGVGGDAHDGDTVTLTVNGKDFTGNVSAGAYAIEVDGSDLLADADSTIGASVSTKDGAGNIGTGTATKAYTVDAGADAIVTIDAVSGFDAYKAAQAETTFTITGTVGGDVKDGNTVTLTVNGKDFAGTVSSGVFSIAVDGVDLVADSDLVVDASVTATDVLGNSSTGKATMAYGVTGTAAADVLPSTAELTYVRGLADNDTLTAISGNVALDGGDGDDTLTGGDGNDILSGGAGADILDGKGGANTLRGGGGGDTYYVSSASDVIVEEVSGGEDTVRARVSYTLAAGVKVEQLTTSYAAGTAAINLTGNEFNQTLIGNAGNNTLDGKNGADVMIGRAGDDIYYVDDAGDKIVEDVGGGYDVVAVRALNYALNAGAEVERLNTASATGTESINLTGNEFDQTLLGNAGSNILDGKGGIDIMRGRAGDDTYYVDNAADVVVEDAGQGYDTVAARTSYTLAAGVEVERLVTTSSAGTSTIDLTGNEFAQSLVGNAGDNILDGKGGADDMRGGAGNDTYYVDDAGDIVVETAGQGIDVVKTSVSYAVGSAEVEQIGTTDVNGTDAINLTGNAFNQTIYGNAGNNILDGKGGQVDTFYGYGGNDTYIVTNTADVIVEDVGQGTDSVAARTNYTLGAGVEVERLSTTSNSGTYTINLTGNEFAQTIIGNAGINIINGKGGADTLRGYGDNDTFVFDTALGPDNIDTIVDFNKGDKIQLDDAIFNLTGGPLDASAFHVGSAAADASDRIIYDDVAGKLYYDADGNGAGEAIQFAKLSAGLALTHDSFTVI